MPRGAIRIRFPNPLGTPTRKTTLPGIDTGVHSALPMPPPAHSGRHSRNHMKTPPANRLGVLIHGAGWVAGQQGAAFTNNPATGVVAVSSRSKSSADRLVEEHGLTATTFDDLHAALAHDSVDIVCVCTPQHVHCENVLAAAAAGKHIVIEKPAAISIGELRSMREAVAMAGVKTIVSFVLRWNPLLQQIKRHIATGDLGEVFRVEADHQSDEASALSGHEMRGPWKLQP
jgi:predicted dehydrogenase